MTNGRALSCLLQNSFLFNLRRLSFLIEVGWLCLGLTSQSTIFQSCRDGAIASWVINQYFRGVKCLAQGHNTAEVGLEPRTSRSGVRHSTTEPPRSVAEWSVLPTSDHGVTDSNPTGGEILPKPKKHFIAQSFSCSPFHRLEMTEILLKGRKTLTHPSIHLF